MDSRCLLVNRNGRTVATLVFEGKTDQHPNRWIDTQHHLEFRSLQDVRAYAKRRRYQVQRKTKWNLKAID